MRNCAIKKHFTKKKHPKTHTCIHTKTKEGLELSPYNTSELGIWCNGNDLSDLYPLLKETVKTKYALFELYLIDPTLQILTQKYRFDNLQIARIIAKIKYTQPYHAALKLGDEKAAAILPVQYARAVKAR